MTLMQKAERRNEKRKAVKQNRFENSKADWRNVKLVDHGEDSSETEDEDDGDETQRFMSLMEGPKQKKPQVKISWVNGRIHYSSVKEDPATSPVPERKSKNEDGINSAARSQADGESQKMVKLLRDTSSASGKEDLVSRRKEEFRERMVGGGGGGVPVQSKSRGKRKFSDRMTLSEANVEDFDNSQDYVNFLQDKLQGIKIKLVK